MKRTARARGVSLVELMIAIVVGLVVVGGAVQLFVNQLDANRRLLLGARVQQDLQLAMGLVERSLRRTGYVDADNTAMVAWRLEKGSIQMKLQTNNWQSLTDVETMLVTRFAIDDTRTLTHLGQLCTPLCSASDGSCPAVAVRSFEVIVEARAATDASVTRQLRQSIRARNDEVTGSCP